MSVLLLALLMYFMNLISNLMENGNILKYVTPFAYADSSQIFGHGSPEGRYILSGFAVASIVLMVGWRNYLKKDIG